MLTDLFALARRAVSPRLTRCNVPMRCVRHYDMSELLIKRKEEAMSHQVEANEFYIFRGAGWMTIHGGNGSHPVNDGVLIETPEKLDELIEALKEVRLRIWPQEKRTRAEIVHVGDWDMERNLPVGWIFGPHPVGLQIHADGQAPRLGGWTLEELRRIHNLATQNEYKL